VTGGCQAYLGLILQDNFTELELSDTLAPCNLSSWLSGVEIMTLMVRVSMTGLNKMEIVRNLTYQESNSLCAARHLIGGLPHQCDTYGETHVSARLVSMDYRNLLFISTMGLSMICETLKDASLISTKSSKIAQQALAFIEGTGLEIAIRNYNLDLDPKQLRYQFYAIFHIHKKP